MCLSLCGSFYELISDACSLFTPGNVGVVEYLIRTVEASDPEKGHDRKIKLEHKQLAGTLVNQYKSMSCALSISEFADNWSWTLL